MKPGDYAWCAIGLGVIGWDATSPHGELLSEAVDRYLTNHPYLTRTVIIYLSAHLLNVIPDRVDPLTRLAAGFRR